MNRNHNYIERNRLISKVLQSYLIPQQRLLRWKKYDPRQYSCLRVFRRKLLLVNLWYSRRRKMEYFITKELILERHQGLLEVLHRSRMYRLRKKHKFDYNLNRFQKFRSLNQIEIYIVEPQIKNPQSKV